MIPPEIILEDIRRVQAILGKFPSRDEYLDGGKYPKSAIVETFGSWTKMLIINGIDYSVKGRRDKDEIRRRSFEHLKKEVSDKKQSAIEPPPLVRNLILLPDLHSPVIHPQAFDFVKAAVDKYGFDYAACTGDEIDGHAWHFHDSDPDALSPGAELEEAINKLKPFYELFPQLDLAESNHGSLFTRKLKHHGLPARILKSYKDVLGSPDGWKWSFEIVLQMNNGKKLLIHHAYSANVLKASQQRGVSCVFGHHHSQFSIQYWRNYDDLFFAAFAGCLVDETALAMMYGKNIMHRPILGLLRVENGIPHLVPMLLDRGNQWTGKIS